MSVNSKMTALAEQVRTLSGGTGKLGIDAMTNAVKGGNDEIGSQTDLIAQIGAALEGKASPGGGITPSGTIEITENGTHDVTNYASAEVNVAASGDGSDLALSLLTREITSYSNPTLTYLGPYAFSGTKVTTLDLPALATIGGYVFYDCTTLSSVVFPALTEVPYNGFRQFTGLVKADLAVASKIGANGFYNCSKLETLILRRTNGICTLAAGTVLTGTKIANKTGYIYVPRALVDTYKAATNWSTFAAQFRAIEDYPDITGG